MLKIYGSSIIHIGQDKHNDHMFVDVITALHGQLGYDPARRKTYSDSGVLRQRAEADPPKICLQQQRVALVHKVLTQVDHFPIWSIYDNSQSSFPCVQRGDLSNISSLWTTLLRALPLRPNPPWPVTYRSCYMLAATRELKRTVRLHLRLFDGFPFPSRL